MMTAIVMIVLVLAMLGAMAFALLQMQRTQKAEADAAKALIKAEAELETLRTRMVNEAQREAAVLLKEAELKAAELTGYRDKVVSDAEREATNLKDKARREADSITKEAELKAKEMAIQARQEIEKQLLEKQSLLDKQAQRLQSKEDNLDKKTQALDQRVKEVEDKGSKLQGELQALELKQQEAQQLVIQQTQRLEQIAGMSREEAKAEMIAGLEHEAKMDAAKTVRRIEEEAQEEALKKAKWAIGTAIQRISSEVVCETTVSTVQLPSDDLKGRIIGREGRNIRAIEKATGCDLIVDDTPESILISSFDPIRREVARQAIMTLLADGRIHPARIEEVVEKTKVEMDQHLREVGENTCIELGFPDIHPKLHKLVGRLKFRTSYGQNVLEHTKEVARIAEYMAVELGCDAKLARRAGLFHDIGKAVDREVEGTHVELGLELLKRFGEKEPVIHAMSCHHGDFEPHSVEAMLVTSADALSAARPGARRDVLENYVKRLEQLEAIANSYKGVQKSYAMQAGREIRIMVDAHQLGDDEAFWLAKDVAKRVEAEMQYPGQIRVTVMRETRAVEYAR